eukprot:CAMPEP_0114243526 /NCGR_PEP_ID=MMETSP0058-20121206/10838_1 /TAXON_ID=36894 /ORGANISM="Pyramimonas parkeae, CCMP726" /LENGTH=126 /DNA_ID=CAMNT_0001356375 /DNA_START=180 /DNA_END=560 /DNA_ORIENTATION=+
MTSSFVAPTKFISPRANFMGGRSSLLASKPRSIRAAQTGTITKALAIDTGLLLAVAETVKFVAEDADTYQYGSVAAPPYALAGGAIIVSLAATASIFLLQPGADAAIEMQKRDAETFNKPLGRKRK